ncbi:MAG: uracil-DNA glycosylase [Burkholderiaceae bacterium]|nr:uracil-DNA glycosylase [Burkholderiaceae bacterium]
MAEPNPNPAQSSKRSIERIFVSRLQHGWLKAMGIDVPWIAANEPQAVKPQPKVADTQASMPAAEHAPTRAVSPPPSRPVIAPAAKPLEQVTELDVSTLDLAQVAQSISACQRCGLCHARQQAVPGQGVDKPTILIVGEAPGEQEDLQGKPFVGRSGELLQNMLKAIGHDRDTSVFITNVVKCRPPANRNPRDEEILACAPYLNRQIELLAPKVVLAMGRFAAHALLDTDAPLQALRGSPHMLALAGKQLPVIVTYHRLICCAARSTSAWHGKI